MKICIMGSIIGLLVMSCHLFAGDGTRENPSGTATSQEGKERPLEVLSRLIEGQSRIIKAIPDDATQLTYDQEEGIAVIEGFATRRWPRNW